MKKLFKFIFDRTIKNNLIIYKKNIFDMQMRTYYFLLKKNFGLFSLYVL